MDEIEKAKKASEIIYNIWPVISALVVSIIWIIRLEAKVQWLQKDHDRVENDLDDHKEKQEKTTKSLYEKIDSETKVLSLKMDKVAEEVGSQSKTLARIEGRLYAEEKKN